MNISVLSPAKINLHLKVFEKNADGYHRVETSMIKVGLYDDIELNISEGEGVTIQVDEPFAFLSDASNLAYRAAKLFLQTTGIQKSVDIHIQKKIPLGAGLGGGSSNAGVVLQALNKALGYPMSEVELMKLGKQLGADVPFFAQGSDFGLMKGRGDELVETIKFPALPLVIIYPNIHASTAKVYQSLGRALTWDGPNGISGSCNRHIRGWKDADFLLELGNDLQEVTQAMHPEIRKLCARLKEHGAMFSQMSGSGASVFGLFETMDAAKKAASFFEESNLCFTVYSGTQSVV